MGKIIPHLHLLGFLVRSAVMANTTGIEPGTSRNKIHELLECELKSQYAPAATVIHPSPLQIRTRGETCNTRTSGLPVHKHLVLATVRGKIPGWMDYESDPIWQFLRDYSADSDQ